MKKPEIRYLNDMKDVVYDKKWLKIAKNFPVYYVYRGAKKPRRTPPFFRKGRGLRGKKDGLRYDITVIPPKMLGQEFPKTKGHSHPFKEVYQVLSGEGLFLLQKCQNKKVKDVFWVKVRKGGVLVIPQGYEHLIINSSKKALKTGNWLSQKCRNLYDFIEKMRGACYFAIAQKSKIKNQKSKIKWIKNKNYKKIPKLRFKKPLKKMPKNLRSFLERAGSST